ncbi:hypothetical protein BC835DRAFT_1311394 [Cytidiella melzeri]|nr:hypothetical protein BC835DRAFT_1311394 [Cytidiella melzeri]
MKSNSTDSALHQQATVMLNATNNEHGTVAGLASWVNNISQEQDNSISALLIPASHPAKTCALSLRQKTDRMDSVLYTTLLNYFYAKYPEWHIHSYVARPRFSDSVPLTDTAIFFDHITMCGQHFHSSRLSGNRSAALVEVKVTWALISQYGKLLKIFRFQQSPSHLAMWLGHVCWFKPWYGPQEMAWTQFSRLDMRLWYLDEYETPANGSEIIKITQLHSLLGRRVVTVGSLDAKLWATVTLDHPCIQACSSPSLDPTSSGISSSNLRT